MSWGKESNCAIPSSGGLYRDAPYELTSTGQEDALDAASRWARRYLMPPSLFRRCVTKMDSVVEGYARAHHVIERRRIVPRWVPAHGYRKKDEQPLPNPAAYDPWQFDDSALVEATNVIARCPACSGTKKTICQTCGGSARVRCGFCGGGGKVQGQRGLKNCPECRGSGQVRCGYCSRGKVDCVTCDTAGRVEAWLAINHEQWHHVPAYPENSALLIHKLVHEAADFDSGRSLWPNRLVDDTGHQYPSSIQIPPELAAQLDPRVDRVMSTRIQRFASEVYRFGYATLLATGTVEVAGRPPHIAPSSNWKPLLTRAYILGGATIVSLILLGTIYSGYVDQSAWHHNYGHGAAVGWLGFLMAAAIVVTLAGILLPRPTWSAKTAWAPAGVAGATLLATIIAFNLGGPTRAEADDALSQGDLTKAKLVADSMIALDQDTEGARVVLDQVQYRNVLSAETLETMSGLVAASWYSDDYSEKAQVHLLEYARTEAARFSKSCDVDGLGKVQRYLGAEEASRLSSVAALCRAQKCTSCGCVASALDASDKAPKERYEQVRDAAYKMHRTAFDKVISDAAKTTDAEQRLSLLNQALGDSDCIAKLGAPIEATVLAKTKVDQKVTEATVKQRRALAAAEAERKRRAEEMKQKQEEARQKRAEAIRQAQERARASVGDSAGRIQCNDGTYSPSCEVCRRGCCSHHGGCR